jgi:alkylated DNA repair dioxygenase AlkB
MGDVDLITKIFDKLSLGELMKCRDHLSTAIMTARGRREHEVNSKRVQDYVVVDKDFAMDTVAAAGVVADLECLNFRPNKTHPVTKWLTTSGLTYSWDANKDHQTVKQPVNLEDSKFIHTLMLELNKKLGVTFNSCLASYYSDGTVYARLHDDNEESLDQSVPITVVSLGGERVIDFLHKGADGRSKPAHSITAVDGGLYSMLPGCQEYFKHRVNKANKNSNLGLGRFSLSFRRIKTTSDPVNISPSSTPVKLLVQMFDNTSVANNSMNSVELDDGVFKTPPSTTPKKKKTTVLFGTSITLNIHKRVDKLKNGRKFVNVSNWGAKICNILSHLQDFHDTHDAATDVEKIIFSLGTNDIKFARRGVSHLKRHVIVLIEKAKFLFPDATILFQCCLPIRNIYTYTVKNVLNFNSMLKSLCYDLNCVYVDCFRLFLSADESDHNHSLFYDWLHLHWNGKGVLGNFLCHVINQNSYLYCDSRPLERLRF